MDVGFERYPPALRLLYDPVTAVPLAIERRRWFWPLLFLVLAVVTSGTALALRLDAQRLVLPKMEAAGELAKASEREVEEAIEQAGRVALVGGVAKGVFLMPLSVLFIAVALKIISSLLGRKLLFAHAFSIAAVSMIPVAVFHLLYALVAWRQAVIVPTRAPDLVPSSLAQWVTVASPKLKRVLTQVDFFNFWSVGLMGLGLAAGQKTSRTRGLLTSVVLYLAFAVVMAALPGLAPPQGGPQ